MNQFGLNIKWEVNNLYQIEIVFLRARNFDFSLGSSLKGEKLGIYTYLPLKLVRFDPY